MVLSSIPCVQFAIFTFVILSAGDRVTADDLPECLSLDPTDHLSIELWRDCGNGDGMFSYLEYADTALEPSDSRSLFYLAGYGPGKFCIESELATLTGNNFVSELVYRLQGTEESEAFAFLFGEDGIDYFRLKFIDIGTWDIIDDWIFDLGMPYKVRIAATLQAGESLMIEKLVVSDLDSERPECKKWSGVTDPTTDSTDGFTTDGLWTSEPPTTDDYWTSESPFSETTEFIATTEIDWTSDSPTTEDSWTSDSPTTEDSWTSDSPTTEDSWTSDSPTTEESWTSDSPTTEDSQPSETTETEPSSSVSSTDPGSFSSQGTTALPPGELERENDSKEAMWMTIAIVFISLFCLAVLFSIYNYLLPRLKAARIARNARPPPTAVKSTKFPVPERTGFMASRLPRLYVDRLRGKPVITAQHKSV